MSEYETTLYEDIEKKKDEFIKRANENLTGYWSSSWTFWLQNKDRPFDSLSIKQKNWMLQIRDSLYE